MVQEGDDDHPPNESATSERKTPVGPLGFCLSVFLLMPFPTQEGDTLPQGTLPAASVLQGWVLITGVPLAHEHSAIGNTPISLLNPFEVVPENRRLLERILNQSGLFMKPVGAIQQPRAYWVTQQPLAEPPRPKPVMKVVHLKHLDPEEGVRILRAEAGHREKNLDLLDRYSNFVASPRTRSIVVTCASTDRLQHYLKVLESSDQRPPKKEDGLALKVWKARFLRASILEELLTRRWEDRGGQPIRVVVNEPTNSLLFRIPRHLWPEAEKILQELDQQKNF